MTRSWPNFHICLAFYGVGGLLLVFFLASAVGCKKSEGGSSLTQQYEQALKIPSDEARARKLATIGEAQLKAKDNSGAERSFAAAREAAELVTDPMQRAGVYITLAVKQATSSSVENQRSAVRGAAAAIDKIEIPEAKAENLADLGVLQARFVDREVALATIQSAEELIDQVADFEGKVNVLSKVAKSYRAIRNQDEAERVLASASEMAAGIESPSERIRALIAVARTQNGAGQKKTALATLAEAVKVSEGITDDATLAGLRRLDIADAYREMNEGQLARRQIDKAQELATGPGAGSTAQEVLDRIGRMQ